MKHKIQNPKHERKSNLKVQSTKYLQRLIPTDGEATNGFGQDAVPDLVKKLDNKSLRQNLSSALSSMMCHSKFLSVGDSFKNFFESGASGL